MVLKLVDSLELEFLVYRFVIFSLVFFMVIRWLLVVIGVIDFFVDNGLVIIITDCCVLGVR